MNASVFYNSRRCLIGNICYYTGVKNDFRTRWPGCVALLDITMHYPIVPYDPLPAAVAYSQHYVLSRKVVGQIPYAKAFFRHLTGRSDITATSLQRIIPLYNQRAYRYLSKARILDALDTAIATRGAFFPHPLPLDLQDRLFPYQAHRKEQRTLHHIDIHLDRDRKVEMKRRRVQHAAYDTEVERAWQALSAIPRKELGAWYSEWSEHEVNGNNFSDDTFRSLLRRWHKGHGDGQWSWEDLYHSIPTWKVVLDMQLDDTD